MGSGGRRGRRSKRQRGLLEMAGGFRVCGLVGVVIAPLLAVAGVAATFAWYVGAASGWMLGLGLLLPLVARFDRLTWRLVAGAIPLAFVGGAVYLAAPSDATWWLGSLTMIPAAALGIYFSEPTGRQRDSSGGPWTPPSPGGL